MVVSRSHDDTARAADVLDPQRPTSPEFRDAVSAEVSAFLAQQAPVLDAIGSELAPVWAIASQLLSGGKRLRPAFCVWGYVAAAGVPTQQRGPLLRAAASLEMLHVSALVHDDVMDGSDLRRGRPAAHRQLEALHAGAGWLGEPGKFGVAGAILLGDLLLMWSVEMLHRAGLPVEALQRALPVVEAMRTEVTCGQYLDVVAQALPLYADPPASGSMLGGKDLAGKQLALAAANRVVEFKSARYTVQRPCQLGAALGGADDRLSDALAAYGSPLGRAFQFRDDLLGVFGDTRLTGKPSGDDLREGKRTVLVAHAFAHTNDPGRRLLRQRLGDPTLDENGVARLQQVIVESGAREAVETMIEDGHACAMEALAAADITEEGRTGLAALADVAIRRSS